MTRIVRKISVAGIATLGLLAGGGCHSSTTSAAPPAASTASSSPAVAAATGTPTSFAARPAVGAKARCAVSGEEFAISENTEMSTFNGRTYVFCCSDCKPTFDKNPTKFASK